MKHKIKESAIVEVYNYKTRRSDFMPCKITGIRSASDRPYRVNVETEDGRTFNECAPECIIVKTENP
jgi:hypothetical protein